ncbi:hypothetical protein [Emticicia fluvialis]|uniref:hypothetical protein n=1 Tax=Emticicia fluvialis TaxID=2974474 RepID=UPI002164F90E|nr:hypothetical protein [Emticicia fluvialis]
MKKFALILIMILSFSSVYSQTYEFKLGAKLDQCDINGNPLANPKKESVLPGWLFTVVNKFTDGRKVIFINKFGDDVTLNKVYFYEPSSAEINATPVVVDANAKGMGAASIAVAKETAIKNLIDDASYPNVFFVLSSKEFGDLAEEVEGRFGFGTMVLPLKLRFAEKGSNDKILRAFDFSSEINIGLSLALRLTGRNAALKTDLVASIGLSSIPVDKESTNGFVIEKTNASAITPALGFIFTNKRTGLQISTVLGFDYLSRDLGKNWEYQGWPWLGVGVGFSILKFGDKGSNAKNP